MAQHLHFEKPLRVLGWTLASLFILFLAMEGWRYAVKPIPRGNASSPDQQLESAVKTFQQQQKELLTKTKKLKTTLQNQLLRGASKLTLYNTINSYSDFWGTKLLKNNKPYVWDGFEIEPYSLDSLPGIRDGSEVHGKIAKQNNVLYWQFDVNFSVSEDTNSVVPYHLTTSGKIEQQNALPIGENSEFRLINTPAGQSTFPVFLNFYNPLPDSALDYRVLNTINGDSAGVAYALPFNKNQSLTIWERNNWFWRSIFMMVVFFLGMGLFFSTWPKKKGKWTVLIFQLSLIGIGWMVFHYLNIPSRWIPQIINDTGSSQVHLSYQKLSDYLVKSIFIFLTAVSLYKNLFYDYSEKKGNRFLSTICIGLLTGTGILSVILAFIYSLFQLISVTRLPVMDLNIIPSFQTLLVYLCAGLGFYSAGLALVSLSRFVIASRQNQTKLISATIIIGFGLALLIAQLFIPDVIKLNWSILLCIISLGIIYGIAFLKVQKPYFINQFSSLRSLIIICTLLALVATPVIYQGFMDRKDKNMKSKAYTFSKEEDPYARNLTREMLIRLEQNVRGINEKDLENRKAFIQEEFTNTIESLLGSVNHGYSVDLQFINPRGVLIADYSTELNSPDWVNIFNIPRLSAPVELEQISRAVNRPIVQLPLLKNKEDYETFYRGWIPVYSESQEDPIAWILCSVYKERPNFNKPIRAVMASINYSDLNRSYMMLDYRNDKLYSSAQIGIGNYYPQYNKLLESEQNALANDSLVFYTSRDTQQTFRNLLMKKSPERTIKISSIVPGFRNILFSFFRLNFTLLIFGGLLLLLLHIFQIKKFNFLHHQRFQNRILDNFLLATMLFLILLVFATHYAIRQQNSDIVEHELFNKLDQLTQAVEANPLFEQNRKLKSPFNLDFLVSPLNVDATFYADRVVSESTTPQIYQQHLIPASLSFPVYNQLYNIQKRDVLTRATLASQDLLIGYRSVLSPDGNPSAVIAIPTFTQSPKYNRQLLETTSYLIVFYLIVFGIFILGTAFIARQLTRPLDLIQQGLDKISKGHLNTTIPVTSDDEIGSLAKAYNTMVYKLKELQKELVKAEREAAWKEMAQQVAHEIKNPLTPMKLNIQHLQRQLNSQEVKPEELKSTIKRITHNLTEQIESLNNIASDFSKFSQPLNEEFTNVDINKILSSIADLYAKDSNIKITTEFSTQPIVVKGIADELRRMMINLLKNSFEAILKEGKIELRSYIKEGSAFIEIEDNGKGISETDKSKIFVPNFSTKSSGTGLGLAICKKIAEAHDATISFASIQGKGTIFIIKIPLAE